MNVHERYMERKIIIFQVVVSTVLKRLKTVTFTSKSFMKLFITCLYTFHFMTFLLAWRMLARKTSTWMHTCSVVFDSVHPHGLQPTRLLYPWDFPCKNTGVGCHSLLQDTFLTQRSNLGLLPWQADSLPLSHQGSPSRGETKSIL